MSQPATSSSVAPLRCTAALSHHWLVRRRGGEKVLEAITSLLPGADIYTLVHDPRGWSPADGRSVHTSWLQHVPLARRFYPALLPLMPSAARGVRIPPVDLLVCSDAAIAKAMTPAAGTRVVCYCHSPMRYVWDLEAVYRETLPAMLRPLWRLIAARVRAADRAAAARVDRFIANSRTVAERIQRAYGCEAAVVHPPVDVPDTPPRRGKDDFYLCVGHHVAYKRLDLAVSACEQLGRKLVVIGEGPDVRRLRGRATDRIVFLGWQPDDVIREHFLRARALLFPGEEDFGIVPVEAMAHGCPVVAYRAGGAAETVIRGETGVLFDEQTSAALAGAMQRAESLSFEPPALHRHARRFDRDRFLREMRAELARALESRHTAARSQP